MFLTVVRRAKALLRLIATSTAGLAGGLEHVARGLREDTSAEVVCITHTMANTRVVVKLDIRFSVFLSLLLQGSHTANGSGVVQLSMEYANRDIQL